MNYNLPLDVEEELKNFFLQFDCIDKVVLFGSRARKDNTLKSDIDICIYSLSMTKQEFSKIKYEINELPILFKIDIVHFEQINDKLKENILKEEKLLFGK